MDTLYMLLKGNLYFQIQGKNSAKILVVKRYHMSGSANFSLV